MNVLITAGGTTEPVDNVRSISNASTGRLGCLIAEAYDRLPAVDHIYFVCGINSLLPDSKKAEVIHVSTVLSLETVLRKIIAEADIDIIVHSMAVSDYRIDSVTSLKDFAAAFHMALKSKGNWDITVTEDFISSILQAPELSLNRTGKISSDIDELILTMKKNQKIISIFQAIAPLATLVGFKLLDHVDHHELMEAAHRVLNDNKCSFVLANDQQDIAGNQHIGYLLSEDNSCCKYNTKEEIAAAIVNVTMKKRGLI